MFRVSKFLSIPGRFFWHRCPRSGIQHIFFRRFPCRAPQLPSSCRPPRLLFSPDVPARMQVRIVPEPQSQQINGYSSRVPHSPGELTDPYFLLLLLLIPVPHYIPSQSTGSLFEALNFCTFDAYLTVC